MTRRLVIAVTAAIALTVLAPAAGANDDDSLPARYIVPGDNVFPEGIAREHGTARFYVSSAGDGTIYRRRLDRPRMHVFLPGGQDGRTLATGIEVRDGMLYVSGADTGRVFIYSTATGELVKAFRTAPVGFLNDVAIVPSGAAFFTDSFQPVLYRVTTRALAEPGDQVRRLVPWLRFEGTPLQYEEGFNLNGIVTTKNGRFLLAVQSNTGELFRIDVRTKDVVEVRIANGDLIAGDGMLLRGHRLFVAQNAIDQVTIVRLGENFGSGRIVGAITDPSFSTPTTIEAAREHLLVVNSQFNAQPPAPPFTVSTVPLPED
jgi:sugar lactone lactonase YvrE